MQGPEALHLEDALEDNPQTRSLVGLFEQDAHQLHKYVKVMYEHAQRIWNAEKELADATYSLAEHVRQYDSQHFPLDTDPDSVLSATLKQLTNSLEEISSWHHMCSAQVGDGMVYPLSKFVDADMQELFRLQEQYVASMHEKEQALSKYCRQSRKRESERQKLDINEEVYVANKKFHTLSMNYYAHLNALQYRRKVALLEPLLGYLHSMKSFFGIGHETLSSTELDEFLANISSSVREVQNDLGAVAKDVSAKIEVIGRQSEHEYYAEPLPEMPHVPPNTGLSQKAGFLFYRTKIAGMVNKWDRCYFYTLGCHLMQIPKGEVVGSAVMDLDRTVVAQVLDEDRKNVFQVSNGKRVIVMQALNERERDEWISTIHNISTEAFAGGRSHSIPKEAPAVAKTERTPSLPNTAVPKGSHVPRRQAPQHHVASQELNPYLANTPIQFDMFSPSEEKLSSGQTRENPVRINPFDQCGSSITAESAKDTTCSFWEVFTVRFLGSMQVPSDRGDQLVCETMRHILAARMMHNVFKMAESHMVITQKELRIMDPSHQLVRAVFPLSDVSFWTIHKENTRLLGFITVSASGDGIPTYTCHIFEAHASAEEICNALSIAANIALKALMEQQSHTENKELELLKALKLSENENALLPPCPAKQVCEDDVTGIAKDLAKGDA
ncbi:DCC-interacting protein 13-alpha-like isoform X2 [Ornithodoros turicata]|uniref:DCC-interacting protein 13-alpha-like isoform X2 n=1 Tax=Ornithodoros turicata TaxID=34597 RepID=UPI0031386A10